MTTFVIEHQTIGGKTVKVLVDGHTLNVTGSGVLQVFDDKMRCVAAFTAWLTAREMTCVG